MDRLIKMLRSDVFEVLRRREVSEQCFAEVAMITQQYLSATPTAELTQARAEIARLREALENARQVLAEAPYDLEIRTTMDRIAAVLGGDTQ